MLEPAVVQMAEASLDKLDGLQALLDGVDSLLEGVGQATRGAIGPSRRGHWWRRPTPRWLPQLRMRRGREGRGAVGGQ